IALAAPEKVGIDRLLGAVAANHLRAADQPAIAIDVGSAITIDVIDAAGVFRGGAILPGIGMGARALHTFTDLLPQSELSDLTASPPEPVGIDTVAAIHAGLFWGAIGAMREIVFRVQHQLDRPPLVLLTGGAAPLVAELLAGQPSPMSIQCVPHLVLGGTVLARQRQS
ncbi:MAG: type III pantothenate kinase, partial [Pirellulales bacterium]